MLHTVILRFSDSEADTIGEHRLILNNNSNGIPLVCWGWWRPVDEDTKVGILREFKALVTRNSINVGLANTKKAQFFQATCIDIAFAEDAFRIPSPHPDRTPAYYRGDRFPAWFMFSDIKDVTEAKFRKTFGAMPKPPETLFPVGDNVPMAHGVPGATQIIDISGKTVLHISDLHFGEFHGYPLLATEEARFERPLDERIAQIATIARHDRSKVGAIVVSGDLISKGDANSYGHVSAFLESLCERLNVQKEAVIVVPGNHDIYLKNSQHVTRDYGPRGGFILFLRGFFGQNIREPENTWRFRCPDGTLLTFVGLNSVRPRSEALRDFGYIGEDIYGPLLEPFIAQLPEPNEIRLAVFHHHLVLPPIKVWPMYESKGGDSYLRPISVMLDAGIFLDHLQRAHFRFALHGHHHFPFIAQAGYMDRERAEDVPLYVFGGGSAGARREQLEMAFSYNSVAFYTPTQEGMDAEIWRYSSAEEPKEIQRLTLSRG